MFESSKNIVRKVFQGADLLRKGVCNRAEIPGKCFIGGTG